MDKRVGLKRYELSGRKVLFYFDEVSFIQIPPCCVSYASFLRRCVQMPGEAGGGGGSFAHYLLFVIVFTFLCLCVADPQPVYDMCGLSSS